MLPQTMMLRTGKMYKLRDLPKILTFPQHQEGSEEQIYQDLTLFRPHKKDEFKDLTYAELVTIYKSKDSTPLVDGQKNILTKLETVKHRVCYTMCRNNVDFSKIYVE